MPPVMKSDVLKSKGYEVQCTSWENDGDDYRTNSVFFKENEDALFAIELLKKCKSRNNRHNPGIGNSNVNEGYNTVSTDDVINVFQYAYANQNISPDLYNELHEILEIDLETTEPDDGMMSQAVNYLCNFLGYPDQYDYPFIRVAEKIKLNYRDTETTDTYESILEV